jgi:hypothetical protein
MRGELFDGRGFIKGATSAQSGDKNNNKTARDFDLDVKLATVTGYNVEALRGVELRMSRRNGHIRQFGMIAKLGANASVSGDLRAYPGGRQVVYLESNDAGALLRFTDMYSRVIGGQMWIAMDPPSADQQPQEGVINVRDFAIRGESELQRVASGSYNDSRVPPQAMGAGVTFARMRAEFTRATGKLSVRDGVVWGPRWARRWRGNSIISTMTCGCAARSFRPMRSTTSWRASPSSATSSVAGKTRASSG